MAEVTASTLRHSEYTNHAPPTVRFDDKAVVILVMLSILFLIYLYSDLLVAASRVWMVSRHETDVGKWWVRIAGDPLELECFQGYLCKFLLLWPLLGLLFMLPTLSCFFSLVFLPTYVFQFLISYNLIYGGLNMVHNGTKGSKNWLLSQVHAPPPLLLFLV